MKIFHLHNTAGKRCEIASKCRNETFHDCWNANSFVLVVKVEFTQWNAKQEKYAYMYISTTNSREIFIVTHILVLTIVERRSTMFFFICTRLEVLYKVIFFNDWGYHFHSKLEHMPKSNQIFVGWMHSDNFSDW